MCLKWALKLRTGCHKPEIIEKPRTLNRNQKNPGKHVILNSLCVR